MIRLLTSTITITISLFSTSILASPKAMIIHNIANKMTNAYVDGIPAPNPAAPNTTARVAWFIVQAGCRNHKAEGICPAVIKMGIDSPAPITVGTLYVNLDSGEILPSQFTANGYTVNVNGPGEITVENAN